MKSFKLAEFVVHPAHNKISLGDKTTKIEPKIMQVLCFLVERQGQVTNREEIAKTLWPDAVVGLEVVTRAIFELRKVLSDSAQHPKFIETIARKGYCFIYPVDVDESKDTDEGSIESSVNALPSIATDKSKLLTNVLWGILLIMLVILASIIINRQSSSAMSESPLSIPKFDASLLTHLESFF